MSAPRLAAWYGSHAGPAPSDSEAALARVRRLVAAFLQGRSVNTARTYASSLEDFRRFVGAVDVGTAAELLVTRSMGDANAMALEYRAHLMDRGLSSGTVNLRLAALRSLVKCARMIGVTPWVLEVPRLPDEALRETRGPGRDGFLKLMTTLEARSDAKAVRDRLILRLLFERALRCSEVQQLDLNHVDLDAGAVSILGKGRRAREWVALAPSTLDAMREWIETRGSSPGPLFPRFMKGQSYGPGRISRQGLYRVVRQLGETVGIRARPHGLRHAAITDALDHGADVRAVQRFARHRNINMTIRYDDNRQDLGGQVADLIAVERPGAKPRAKRSRKEPPGPATVHVPPPAPVGPTPREQALQRGQTSPKTRLTDSDVLELRRRYTAGETPTALAAHYRISTDQVQNIVKRRSWKHLPDAPPGPQSAEEARARGMSLLQWLESSRPATGRRS